MTASRTLVGLGVSPGVAIGKPLVVENRPLPVVRRELADEDVDREVARLRTSAERAAERLVEFAAHAAAKVGEESAAIFEAHRLMLKDPALLEQVERTIRDQRVNAEWALEQVVRGLLSRFKRLGDVYLRERQSDLLDVASELQRNLQGRFSPPVAAAGDRTGEAILVADDIPPSQAIQLAVGVVQGFASEAGGATAHTTIIAKSLGMPAVVGVHGLVEAARQAPLIIVDGFEGHVLVDPDEALVAVYRLRAEEHRRHQQELLQMAHMPGETTDGHRISLLANVDLLHEVDAARAAGAEGVGLFRSEFLFLQASPDLPDEEDQFRAYSDLLSGFPGLPVTIRTFDLGGKKLAQEVLGNPEGNPVLGLRGVRLCLQMPDFFRSQLRALLRAAGTTGGHLRIMIPLVGHLEEIRTVRILIERLLTELAAEGHPVPEDVPIGVMIEVPAAAMIADQLAREASFFAIGTNDLTQYTLAVDRANEQVAELYRPFHPAVLRLLDKILAAGRRAGIPVSLCGEMAADPLAVPLLVGLGLKEFSMHPPALPVVRNLVRSISYREARRMARTALGLCTAKAVEEYLLERLSGLLSHLKVRFPL